MVILSFVTSERNVLKVWIVFKCHSIAICEIDSGFAFLR